MSGVINMEGALVEAQMFGNRYENARVMSSGDLVKVWVRGIHGEETEARFREVDALEDAEWKDGHDGSVIVTGVSRQALEALGRKDAAETWVIKPRRCKGCR